MKTRLTLLAALCLLPCLASGEEAPAAAPDVPLHKTIAALDAALFDAFNRCSDENQLERHAGFFAEDVEFYHDMGGVTWTRDEMLANTRQHACGNFSRELVAGTLVVHPVKDFGAISQGSHRFCQFSTGSCEGLADFTMVWRHKDGAWKVTRVLSYGHRPAAGGS
jgi:hypothetical protein